MSEKIALLTDSTSDLGAEAIEKYGIKVLPLKVVYADRQYEDGIDITPEEVYATIDEENPKTSVPTPFEAQQMLARLRDEGFTHVLAVHISSGLSGTAEMVKMVSQDFKDLVVEVIDSRSLSMGLGYIILEAGRWLEKKMSFAQIVERARNLVDRSKVFFVVGTLEYLQRGGRIGRVSATLGEFLNVKPIISINKEGVYYTYKKIRGRRRSIDELFSIAREFIEKQKCRVAVMHGACPEEAAYLVKKVEELATVVELVTGPLGPVMGVHAGPGLLGLVICPCLD
ncbi:MAG: DegV family protein [Firmicutes bacterium]|nr:DegV family protein [Bacillota bacterium]